MIFINLLERKPAPEKPEPAPVLLGRPAMAHSFVRMVVIAVAGALLVSVFQDNNEPRHARTEPAVKMASPLRLPNSFSLPDLPRYQDDDDVLDNYPAYLSFVIALGTRYNSKLAKGLEAKYASLRQRDPRGAANFLRGLREEILHKLLLSNIPVQRATVSNPVIKKLVRDYLGEWYHEADEYLFRAIARREEN